jgi:hypothetical protein
MINARFHPLPPSHHLAARIVGAQRIGGEFILMGNPYTAEYYHLTLFRFDSDSF